MRDGTDFDPIAASIDLMRAQIAKFQSAADVKYHILFPK